MIAIKGLEIFEIEMYYPDDPDTIFTNLVCSYDCVPDGYSDDDIYYYGLDEEGIKHSIEHKEAVAGEFVITSYEKVDYKEISEDERFAALPLCMDLVGEVQCTNNNVECFESEEGEEDGAVTLCTHCWIMNSTGRCERETNNGHT